MHHLRIIRLLLALVALVATGACRASFQPRDFGGDLERLFQASSTELQQRHWDNAIRGFERLTIELPARDPMLPRAIYHLAEAHAGKKEHLLAAQQFVRVAESFPLDTLADDALLNAGRQYARLWRKPSLDATYGEMARSTLESMVALYPQSPLAGDGRRELAAVNDQFAQKLFQNGMFYYRRKGYESALVYFRDVVGTYPDTPTAREAMLQMVDAYRRINYREDVEETCDALRRKYPGDGAVQERCGAAPATTATTPE